MPTLSFTPPLLRGLLLKRYKRFLADIETPDGETITAHCPNSGSLRSVAVPGAQVRYSISDNPKRKLKYTLEMIKPAKVWVGINTLVPNRIIAQAARENALPEFNGYTFVKKEATYEKGTRFDLLLQNVEERLFYVEVKNVTYAEGKTAFFPDAVTSRGLKHLNKLMQAVRDGHRAGVFYLVQRADCTRVAPSAHIDPAYTAGMVEAKAKGVEFFARMSRVSPQRIVLGEPLEVAAAVT